MFDNSIVNSMQIPDIKRIVWFGQIGIEMSREKGMPGVVPQVHKVFASVPQLIDEIGLFNGCACEIGSSIHKCRQCTGSEALQSLQRCRGRICNEGKQESMLWLIPRSVVQHI